MHLAQVDEYKQKFEYFISFPKCEKVQHRLEDQMDAILGDYLAPHTSHSIDVDGKKVYGWAFFASKDPDNDIDDGLPCEINCPDEELDQKVKEFILHRIKDFMMHEIEYGPAHDRSVDMVLYDGIEFHKDVEVNCFYFYDNPKWYE